MEKLSLNALEIGNALYRVYELEYGYENGFRKNNAYHYKDDIDEMVYPYRGELKSFKELFENPDLSPGFYSLRGRVPVKIQLKPAVGRERELYSPEAVFNLMDRDSVEKRVKNEDIITVKMNTTGGAEWMPELHEDDDANNILLKSAIRLKHMVFADYSPRLEIDAVGKGQGSKGTSAKSNSKRAIEKHKALSMSKMVYYCNAFDLEPVIGLRDKPGARDPMFDDGKVMLFYPCSEPYSLDNSITVNELKDEIDRAHVASVNTNDGSDDMYDIPY